MAPKASQAVKTYLAATATDFSRDLIQRVIDNLPNLETQINVGQGVGSKVQDRLSTFTNDEGETWFSFRIPKNPASDEAFFNDFTMPYSLEDHAEAIGSTGWDWKHKQSLWVGFDFDSIVGHAEGVGITDEELIEIRQKCTTLPYVEIRRSTGGTGLHLYVMLDGFSTSNHTEHAAVGSRVLDRISEDVGVDFSKKVDCLGGNLWVWHKRASEANRSFELLSPASRRLTAEDLPDWRDHLDLVRHKSRRVRLAGLPKEEESIFEQLAHSYQHVPLDDTHNAIRDTLAKVEGCTTMWVQGYYLLQTHTVALAQVHKQLGLKGVFETTSPGTSLAEPNCLAGDTGVLTQKGIVPIRDLAGKTVKVLTKGRSWVEVPFRTYGVQPVYDIVLKKNRRVKTIRATGDHRWFGYSAGRTSKRITFDKCDEMLTCQLQAGARLATLKPKYKSIPGVAGIQHGIIWGDGTGGGVRRTSSVSLFGEKRSLTKYFSECPVRKYSNHVEIWNLPKHFKSLPSLEYDRPYLYGWLAGYFATDGCVSKEGRCILVSTDEQSILHARQVCHILGIETSMSSRKSNSGYKPVIAYKLVLCREDLSEEFFLRDKHKKRFLVDKHHRSDYWTVVSVSPAGNEEVYCCTVPETGSFVLEDFIHTGNCFLFPFRNGAWKVFRFGRSTKEHACWDQSTGWTWCWYNRDPNLSAAASVNGGAQTKTGWQFQSLTQAKKTLETLGVEADLRKHAVMKGRAVTMREELVGGERRMVIQVPKLKGDKDFLEGWNSSDSTKHWTAYLSVPAQDDEDVNQGQEHIVRCLETADGGQAGWAVKKKDGEWTRKNNSSVKYVLQSMGLSKGDSEIQMGHAELVPWKLVTIPFTDEYPGNRQWNLGAPQLSVPPAPRPDGGGPSPHPYWDLLLDHLGGDLDQHIDPAVIGFHSGRDYLQGWLSSILQYPYEPLPYLFFYGEQASGKSTFHEAFDLLVTGGVVKAARALTSKNDFNGELAGAVLCVIEEIDLTKDVSTLNRIKEVVTSKKLSIRKMRVDPFMLPNTTHWVHCANSLESVPVFDGDSRITMCYVPTPKKEIPKAVLLEQLKAEAPAILRTLLDFELPPITGRLRIPVIDTGQKKFLMGQNRSDLEKFILEKIEVSSGSVIKFSEFFDAFHQWLPDVDKAMWSRNKTSRKMPVGHATISGSSNVSFVSNARWK